MKRILTLIFSLYSCTDIFTQENTIFEFNDLRLSLEFNNYSLWEVDPADTLSDAIVTAIDLSAGHVFSNDSLIICYDTIRYRNEKFEFKKLDVYRIQLMNDPPFFKRGDILYANVISDSIGRPAQHLFWKEGKRHGLWVYFFNNGSNYVLYENGKIVKEYFKTNEEIYRDSFK